MAGLLEVFSLVASAGECCRHEIAGGQQERVVLARDLARKPKLMLLD